MIAYLYYINNRNERIDFNQAPPNLSYPVKFFDTYEVYDDQEIEKGEYPGEWASFSYPKRRIFECNGDVVGYSTTDYITKRLALKSKITPPNQKLTARRHGTLYVRYDGMTEDVWFYVRVTSCRVPMSVDYGFSVSEFQIVWKAFDPYGYGIGSGQSYVL